METLNDRKVHSEWKGKTVRGRVSEGCPQGGVLSSLLWNLVADELLRILDREKIFAVAYADDFALLVKGKFEEVLPNIIERALRLAREWFQEKSLGTYGGLPKVVGDRKN